MTVDAEALGRAIDDILNLSRAYRLSAYDAAYLELAMHLSLPIATLDTDLIKAAKAVSVVVL